MTIPTKTTVLLVLLLSLAAGARAEERGAAALDQALLDLSNDLRVVFVSTRPGDTDWATLARLRRAFGVETHVVFLTRGEGGLSEAGPELNEELGRVREREVRAAAAAVGAEVEFLGLSDPGFTRDTRDVIRGWGGEELTHRLVGAMRRARPHVVLLNSTEASLADAWFWKAGDEIWPERGPAWPIEWTLEVCSDDDAEVRVPVGEVDPVRGLSWAAMESVARRAQPSLGAPGPAHAVRSYTFRHASEGPRSDSLLGDLPVPRPEWRTESHRSGTREEILARVLALHDRPEKKRPPEAKIHRAAALAQGVELVLDGPPGPVPIGEACRVKARLRNGGSAAVTWGGEKAKLAPQSVVALPALTVTPKAPVTTITKSVTVFLGPKAVPVELSASTTVTAHPELELAIAPWGRVFRPATDLGDLEQEISRFWVEIVNHGSEVRAEVLSLRVEGTDSLKIVEPGRVEVPADGRRWVRIEIHAKKDLEDGLYPVEVSYGPATVRDSLRVLDVRIVGELNVGVVTTIGDDVVQFLHAVGIRPTLLSDQDLIERDLDYFNTIYLGPRAYHERPVLAKVNKRLMAYVENGGHLVVNHHRPEEWSSSFAPFGLEVGRVHVTEEDARVTLEEPQHRIFTFPNQVRERDFDGWRTERGLWLPVSWNREHYRVLLTSADRGDPPRPGLLFAQVGKGSYVYTSFTWFRQLRNLNPGAMKIIANVISYAWR